MAHSGTVQARMVQDSGFWTWPVDVAATRSGSRNLVIGSTLLYSAGAIILLLQAFTALPAMAIEGGAALVLLGVAGSIGALGKVMLTRSRLTYR